MERAEDRFLMVVIRARDSNARRLRFAALAAVVVGALLAQTQWFTLRTGLMILLIGQLGTAAALLRHNIKLSQEASSLKRRALDEAAMFAWFEPEETFLKRLALFENSFRIVGFVALGYGFWLFTHHIWLTLGLGVVYPAVAFFGIMRRDHANAVFNLRTQKAKIRLLLSTAAREQELR